MQPMMGTMPGILIMYDIYELNNYLTFGMALGIGF